MTGPTRICLGVILGAQGIRGEVRIKSFTGDPKAIGAYGPLSDEGDGRRFHLKATGLSRGAVTARIEGVSDRNAAEALKGTRLFVARAALPAPQAEEYYLADLIGLSVEDRAGHRIGRVGGIEDFGAGGVIEVVREGAPNLFLPFTRTVVPLVDLPGGRLVVDPPEEVEVPGGSETPPASEE